MTSERVAALIAATLAGLGAAIAFRTGYRRLSLLADPLGFFLGAWAVSLGLFAVPWISYTSTSVIAWIAIYGSILAFALCGLVGYRVIPGILPALPEAVNLPRAVIPRRLLGLWLLTFVLGLIGFAAFVHAVDAVVGWRAILTDPVAVRTAEGTSETFKQTYGLWKLLTYFTLVSLLLWTIALRLRLFRGWLVILAPFGLISLGEFLLTGERTLFGTAVIWIGLFHLAWRPPTRLRTAAIATVSILGVCTVVFLLLGNRVHKGIASHPEIQSALTTRYFQNLAVPYAYSSSAPPTLSKLMADPNRPRTYGALTLLPLVKAARRAGLAGTVPDDVGAFYAIPFQTMNLYSWLGFFYLDYGLAGCFVLPALFGFTSIATAVVMNRRRTISGAWILSVLVFVIIASPFGNKISSALTWELAAIGAIIGPFVEDGYRREFLTARWRISLVRSRHAFVGVGLVVIAVLTCFSVALAATRDRPVNLKVRMDVVRALSSAAHRAHRAYPTGHYPLSDALASQLHFSDPRLVYLAEPSPLIQPVDPRIVYVFARPRRLRLSMLMPDGTLVEVRQVTVGRGISMARRILPPSEDLLNATFAPRTRGWSVIRGPAARVSLDTTHALTGSTSLLAAGTGRLGLPPSVVQQVVVGLPEKGPGAAYEFSVAMRTSGLTRPLLPEMKLIYEDGSYEFFTTSPADPRVAAAASRWRRIIVRGKASKQLKAIQVFALDTGTDRPVRGSEWLDDARLALIR